jgi:hypothetical protein
MSTQIQTQANKLVKTITDPSTASTYKQTLAVTWTILKETGYLLWLVVCLVLVFGEWIWKTGYRTGWNFRGWVNSLNTEKPSADQVLSETGKSLLEVGKSAAASAIAAAKNQLGIENKPDPPLVMSSPPVSKTASEPAKAETSPPDPSSVPQSPAPVKETEDSD